MGKLPSLDISRWPEHPGEVRVYYEAGEKWMADRGKRRLSALGHRLWEVAAARDTISYSTLAKEFALSHRGPYGVGMWSGLLSEYSEKILGLVFLSSIIVNADSRTGAHPKGLPAPGGWWDGAPKTEPERVSWALNRQAKVWDYCSTHPNPFSA
jgi:hypothetical protein